jgi:hypothetical protein
MQYLYCSCQIEGLHAIAHLKVFLGVFVQLVVLLSAIELMTYHFLMELWYLRA